MDWNSGPGWAPWLVMALAMVGLWALIIFGTLAAIHHATESGAKGRTERDTDRVLDEEFARGRIDAEEYRIRRDVLHGGH